MKNLIFYKTTADFDNTGEVLIYKSLLQFLRLYGDVIINDGVSIQPLFLNRIGVADNERISRRTRIPFIIYILLSGIRNLFSNRSVYFVTGVGEHALKGIKSVIKNIVAFAFTTLLRLCGVKVVRIGMSMRFGGRLEQISEKILSFAFNYYYVRDSISFTYCHNAGIDKCQLAPDLSWGYKIPTRLLKNEQDGNRTLVFSFRDFCESDMDNVAYKEKLTAKLTAIIPILAHKYKILFTHQCNEDFVYMKYLYERLSATDNVTIVDELITLDNGYEYYGQTVMTFSNRLHVMLLAYKFGSPTVCITDVKKHRKITGIFHDNSLDNVLVDINQSDNNILTAINNLLGERDLVESRIRECENSNYGKLSDIFERIFEKKP